VAKIEYFILPERVRRNFGFFFVLYYEYSRIFVYEYIRKPINTAMINKILFQLPLLALLVSGTPGPSRTFASSTRDTLPEVSPRPGDTAGDRLDDDRPREEIIRREAGDVLRETERAQREVQRAEREAHRAEAYGQDESVRNAQREAARSLELAQREVVRAQTYAQSEAVRSAQREVARSLEQAQREFVRAQAEVQRETMRALREANMGEYRKMMEQMASDHLIERGKEFRIEFRDGHLYIDGKEQPPAVYDKYKPYFHSDHQTIQATLGDGIAI
jgi:flagellar biosynthesis GTPase FlhF